MSADTLVAPLAEKPAHVPAGLVRDVDMYDLIRGKEDAQEAWHRVQQTCPDIFWTPRHGGYWMATRGPLIQEIQEDYAHFSHRNFVIPKQKFDHPSMLALDPPEHTPLRKVIMPALTKTALAQLEEHARVAARDALDRIAPRGECEFINEFATVLPIVVFLDMMGLPQEDREMLLPYVEKETRSPSEADRLEAQTFMAGYIVQHIEERKRNPRPDLITHVITADVGDRKITDDEATSYLLLLLFGGLDTVASMIGFVARHLAMHPEHRRRLVEEPAIMQNAIEELIRRYGLSNTAREVVSDYDFHGVSLKAGDMIQIPNLFYGLDDRIHNDPLTVDFDRPVPIRHAAFGNGPHICPGGILARREIKVFLQEWLARIPDFAIRPGTTPKIVTGMVNAIQEMHLVWEPRA
ncbi:MAG: cytochrome P450 [Novosphingobium sp.]|nr:cytochrome P450 [Novosphingobium sp.]